MRQLQTGRAYGLPPPAPGISPDAVGSLEEWRHVLKASTAQVALPVWPVHPHACTLPDSSHRIVTQPSLLACERCPHVQVAAGKAAAKPGQGSNIRSACVRAFQGVSPSLAEELCTLAEVDGGSSPVQLSDEQWARLYGAWRHWLDSVHSSQFQPSVDPQTGRLSVIGTFAEPYEQGIHAAIEDLFQSSQVRPIAGRAHEEAHVCW